MDKMDNREMNTDAQAGESGNGMTSGATAGAADDTRRADQRLSAADKASWSRRAVLASIGAAGAAVIAGGALQSVRGTSGVGASVYGTGCDCDADDTSYQYAPAAAQRTVGDKLREQVSVRDFGTAGDGVADDTAAIQAAINSMTAGGVLHFPPGTYLISDTLHVPRGMTLAGAGLHSAVIRMTDPAKFAINLFTPGTRHETFHVSDFTIQAAYGITNRWELGTDYANTANPTRTVSISDVKFVGVYDAVSDPDAQSTAVPARSALEAFGVGLHLVMVYGALVRSCWFDRYGIAIENIGCTLSKFERNRFYQNARHIHDERVPWYNSSFGMGADNVYEQNDLLDATRVGGITLWRSFGAELRHNYGEHLERHSVKSAPEMVYAYNPDSCKIQMNHWNIHLAVNKGRPFLKALFDEHTLGRASGNVFALNGSTPFNGVLDGLVQIDTLKWDRRYPWHTQLTYQELYPIRQLPYVLGGEQPEWNVLAFDNLYPQMGITGTLANKALPFVEDTTHQAWHLATGVNDNFRFRLLVPNPLFASDFRLLITAEGNAATAGTNGRAHTVVRDGGGTILFNGFAFTNVTDMTTSPVDLHVAAPTALQTFDIDLTNLTFSKVYRIAVVPL